MSLPKLRLKSRRDQPIRAGHPWIFSEAIQEIPAVEDGALVAVCAENGDVLGQGMWNSRTSIRVRMLSRDAIENIDQAFFEKRLRDLRAWKTSRLPPQTTGYRLVHAEADNLPGLIVDVYGEVVVFQLHTLGMDRFREVLIRALQEVLSPVAIVERSDVDVRKIEGLRDQPVGLRFGTLPDVVSFDEAGIHFLADVVHGQKTGFFLDQREARLQVGQLAKGKRVLNLFSYSSAFGVHAAHGGAEFVASIDASRSALELAEKQFAMNGFDPANESKFLFLEADVFELIRDPELPGGPYDVVISDPPALAKSSSQVDHALKAYATLNTACFKLLEVGGILVASSCSGRVTPEDFRSTLRLAAGRAGRDVRLLDWITQPIDHSERLAFPEGRYLKTAILEVRDIYAHTLSS